jgi:hypothetical protein
MSTERETEAECLEKFRARARRIRKANPALTREAAFAMACEQMPITMNKYQYAVNLLTYRGYKAAPLFD